MVEKPTIEELEEILDGTRGVDIEILPSGEIVERMVGDSSASSWPEQDAVHEWLKKYGLEFKHPHKNRVLELCEAVSKYRIQEQKKAGEVTKQKDAEIDHLKTTIENLDMSLASFMDSSLDLVAKERGRIIAVLCEVVVDGQFEFLKDCVEKESK